MYVSYLLDKDVSMYPSSVRHSGGLNLAPQNFVSPPQYPDYGGYHVAAAAAATANLDSAQSPGPSWPTAYGAPLREDWNGYAPGGAAAANAVAHGLNGGSPAAAMGYSSPAEYHAHHHPHHHPHHPAASPSCASGLLQTLNLGPPGPAATAAAEQLSPSGQRRNLCEWMRKPAQQSLGSQVKTRTKDKYRVVYTDHQRLELEKEFHFSRYITIRRKSELAATLGLSERQVKIWFQNRRAKERKIKKKQQQQQQQQQQQPPQPPPQPSQPQPGALRSVPEPLSPVTSLQGSVPGSVPGVLGPAGGVLNSTVTQ
ncbi:homeobox protein CDX-2 [Mus musculus]|uniref:Homeobox protein CDX-2 n=3 Tax=Mus TaxID=862507 RepID=CDX2_MOUSE|nr:homeobox protein CDX-2 [Mus musculus]P43241.1 RecName: Full=Homeobox protein CDX-2; AltName: Full=Caudal-type homeobox protein 2 [Mus musculus]AAA19645.1 Cdx-2 homeobox protein [Mus musculus]AAI03517.1 Caudal type homeo box 2 [Mus musculus]AAI03518.1 Caudal type homeo box 2 [Mus musculus]AAI03520.1 Caudal type homeo box 2 [Mus musculus]AAI03521.1 Caudal type homeo box 2 [Mus musculus]|eukprot:NP_031699.2 homeobox protein CDX-2 [Mus musculus]